MESLDSPGGLPRVPVGRRLDAPVLTARKRKRMASERERELRRRRKRRRERVKSRIREQKIERKPRKK